MADTYTPGPWGWFGNSKHGMYLATQDRGRIYVMGFRRLGMSGAQPTFQVNKRIVDGRDLAIYEVCPEATSADDPRVYRHDIVGFRSADARLIAASPELLEMGKRLDHAIGGDGDELLKVVAEWRALVRRVEGQG